MGKTSCKIERCIRRAPNGKLQVAVARQHVGTFDTIEEARGARDEAYRKNAERYPTYCPPPHGMTPEDFIKQRVAYDPETGVFTWRVTQRHSRPAGSRAGNRTVSGYRYIGFKLGGKTLAIAEHRAAFLLMEGRLPALPVDHIDGVRDNNKWANLREVTPKANAANIATRVPGRSVIRLEGKFYPLIGNGFATFEEAVASLEQSREHA